MLNTELSEFRLFVPTKDSTIDEIRLWLRIGYGCISSDRPFTRQGHLIFAFYFDPIVKDASFYIDTDLCIDDYHIFCENKTIYYRSDTVHTLIYFKVDSFLVDGTRYLI